MAILFRCTPRRCWWTLRSLISTDPTPLDSMRPTLRGGSFRVSARPTRCSTPLDSTLDHARHARPLDAMLDPILDRLDPRCSPVRSPCSTHSTRPLDALDPLDPLDAMHSIDHSMRCTRCAALDSTHSMRCSMPLDHSIGARSALDRHSIGTRCR